MKKNKKDNLEKRNNDLKKDEVKAKKKEKRKVKKVSFFWAYIVIGALTTILGLILAPFWVNINDAFGDVIPFASFAEQALGFLMSALILVYVFTILLYKLRLKKQHKTVKILTAFEFAFMCALAVCCILMGLRIISFENGIRARIIVGLAIWIRGIVEIFGAYFFEKNNEKLKPYPVWYLLINLLLVSSGPLIIVWEAFSDLLIEYVFACLLFIGGILLMIYGGLAKPEKLKKIVEPIMDEQTYNEQISQNQVNNQNESSMINQAHNTDDTKQINDKDENLSIITTNDSDENKLDNTDESIIDVKE